MPRTRLTEKPPARVHPRARVESGARLEPTRSADLSDLSDQFETSTHGLGIEELLHAAARIPKSDGPEGAEPLVGPAQAARAAEAFSRAPVSVRAALERLLSTPTGSGADVARALLLKAIAARAHALVDGDGAEALSTLEAFCVAMKNLGPRELRTRATVLDLDSTKNTHAADPQVLWQTRGAIHDARRADEQSNNDGLFQRFTGACGPTTVQMMLAENDPVMAFAIHDAGLVSFSTTDATATFQRLLLEEYGGGKSLGRVEAWLRARVQNGIGQLVKGGAVDARAGASLRAHLFESGALDNDARAAIAALRARYGFPSDDDVARLRARSWPKADDGITTDALLSILNERFGAALGVTYEAKVFARGHAWRHLEDVVRALKSGVDVPFGCSDPGHWMLLSAVKGRRPHRQLLVSDPDGGRTLWVEERRFLRGTFLTDDLHLAKPGQQPFVDSVVLPRQSGARP